MHYLTYTKHATCHSSWGIAENANQMQQHEHLVLHGKSQLLDILCTHLVQSELACMRIQTAVTTNHQAGRLGNRLFSACTCDGCVMSVEWLHLPHMQRDLTGPSIGVAQLSTKHTSMTSI